LLFLMKSGFTQNTHLDYKYAIKIYNLTSYEEDSRLIKLNDTASYHFNIINTNLQILHPTLAFQWMNLRKNLHEIELTGLKWDKHGTKTEILNDTTHFGQITSITDVRTTLISLRYEYILNFIKRKDKKFVPSIGFGFNPYYEQNNYSPGVYSLFPVSEKYIGLRAFVTPRLTCYLSSKFFMDVNIPICIIAAYYLIDKEDNPNKPLNSRTQNIFDFREMPKMLSGRIGVGMKI
jgi:hypothetical protein